MYLRCFKVMHDKKAEIIIFTLEDGALVSRSAAHTVVPSSPYGSRRIFRCYKRSLRVII